MVVAKQKMKPTRMMWPTKKPKGRDMSRLDHVKSILIDGQTHEENDGSNAPGRNQGIACSKKPWETVAVRGYDIHWDTFNKI